MLHVRTHLCRLLIANEHDSDFTGCDIYIDMLPIDLREWMCRRKLSSRVPHNSEQTFVSVDNHVGMHDANMLCCHPLVDFSLFSGTLDGILVLQSLISAFTARVVFDGPPS